MSGLNDDQTVAGRNPRWTIEAQIEHAFALSDRRLVDVSSWAAWAIYHQLKVGDWIYLTGVDHRVRVTGFSVWEGLGDRATAVMFTDSPHEVTPDHEAGFALGSPTAVWKIHAGGRSYSAGLVKGMAPPRDLAEIEEWLNA